MKLYEIVQEKERILPENVRKFAIVQALVSIIIAIIGQYLYNFEVLKDVRIMWIIFFLGLVTTTYYYQAKYEQMVEVLAITKANSLEIFKKPRGDVFVSKKGINSKCIDLAFENLIYIFTTFLIVSISIVSTTSIYLNTNSSQEILVYGLLIVLIVLGALYSAIKMYKIFVQTYMEIYDQTGYIIIS